MIAVDTSALMAIVLEEPSANACALALAGAPLLISSVTFAEALIVSRRRDRGEDMSRLIARLNMTVTPVTAEVSANAADAYDRWGKGVHPARLNFADCFAYVLARSRDCPLLYVGEDFAQTDVASALADPA